MLCLVFDDLDAAEGGFEPLDGAAVLADRVDELVGVDGLVVVLVGDGGDGVRRGRGTRRGAARIGRPDRKSPFSVRNCA